MSRSTVRTLIVVAAIALAGLVALRAIGARAYSASSSAPWSLIQTGTPTAGSIAAPGGAANDANDADDANSANDPNDADDGQDQELVGSVASLDAANGTFALQTPDGHTTTVALTAQTEFDDGLTSAASLQSGMSVQVEGAQQSDGSIQASKVSLQDQNDQNDPNDQSGQDGQDDSGTTGD